MAGGLNKRGVNGRMQPMAEINVTPMVDVMLVLLIVFMVAAPLLTAGVEVDLPETEAKAITDQGEPLAVTIRADGTVFVQETEIEFDNLVPHLEAVASAGYAQRIYIRGDKKVAYERVAEVMARINAAGYTQLALVTE